MLTSELEQDICNLLRHRVECKVISTTGHAQNMAEIRLTLDGTQLGYTSGLIIIPKETTNEDLIKKQAEELIHARKVVNLYKDTVEQLINRVTELEKRLNVGVEE